MSEFPTINSDPALFPEQGTDVSLRYEPVDVSALAHIIMLTYNKHRPSGIFDVEVIQDDLLASHQARPAAERDSIMADYRVRHSELITAPVFFDTTHVELLIGSLGAADIGHVPAELVERIDPTAFEEQDTMAVDAAVSPTPTTAESPTVPDETNVASTEPVQVLTRSQRLFRAKDTVIEKTQKVLSTITTPIRAAGRVTRANILEPAAETTKHWLGRMEGETGPLDQHIEHPRTHAVIQTAIGALLLSAVISRAPSIYHTLMSEGPHITAQPGHGLHQASSTAPLNIKKYAHELGQTLRQDIETLAIASGLAIFSGFYLAPHVDRLYGRLDKRWAINDRVGNKIEGLVTRLMESKIVQDFQYWRADDPETESNDNAIPNQEPASNIQGRVSLDDLFSSRPTRHEAKVLRRQYRRQERRNRRRGLTSQIAE